MRAAVELMLPYLSKAVLDTTKMKPIYRQFSTRERTPDPSKAALLVIDMQEYFRGIAEPIIPALQQVIRSARKSGIPIIYTQHSHKGPQEDGMLGEWWDGNLVRHGTPEANLMPEIEFTQEDKLVNKHVYSAFLNTDLEIHLKGIQRSEVIIVGVMTNLCCETTARDAFCRGFRVFFSTDATATSTEEYHVSTLRNLGYGFAYLVDVDNLKFELMHDREAELSQSWEFQVGVHITRWHDFWRHGLDVPKTR